MRRREPQVSRIGLRLFRPRQEPVKHFLFTLRSWSLWSPTDEPRVFVASCDPVLRLSEPAMLAQKAQRNDMVSLLAWK